MDVLRRFWQESPVARRVHLLRWALPPVIAVVVLVYQLGIAAWAHDHLGHLAHTLLELAFYGVLGPVVSWVTLSWIGIWLREKEAAEQVARARERHLASITDASAEAILSLAPDGTIRSWNRGATALFGYAPQETIGRPLDTFLVRRLHAPRPLHRGQGDAEAPVPVHYQAVIRRADGQQIPVEVTQTPLADDDQTLTGAAVILRDIREQKAREAILAEERARIARDLHDGVAQGLYFLGLKLDFLRRQLRRDPAGVAQELKALKQTVQAQIQEVRRTIFALRPVDLEGLGFRQAVEKYVAEFGEQMGLEICLRVDGDLGVLSPLVEPQLFRVLQEALNNVAKHARARHVEVCFRMEPGGWLELTVADDGIGFPAPADPTPNGKIGLRQMRERVQALQGQMTLESRPGAGTTLQVRIPVQREPQPMGEEPP